ncbi:MULTISPECIES: hypothetical protein [Streptomyces]|uniref:hypothetical protein n=1 Tax=Streptomyces TaxID=1883 RepID=UPI0031367255
MRSARRRPDRGAWGGVINREGWGVNWNAATEVMVGARVTLEFDIVAVRRS